MLSPRSRPVWIATVSILAVWLVAWGGYTLAGNSKVTAEKVRAYLRGTDLKKLTGDERRKALRRLEDYLNALSADERRTARLDREWGRWFADMTDEEKIEFIEATLPSGVQQMLTAFEQLDAAKRQRAVNDALKQLKEARENPQLRDTTGAPPPPPMSEELQKKMASTGLKTFYTQSSAQAKAELAPLLEEIQRSMEAGRLFRGP